MKKIISKILITCAITFQVSAQDVGSQFNYQGQLNQNGSVATGQYDFQFRLYDAESNGNQINNIEFKDNVEVESGLFKVELDFNDTAYFGEERWLQIEVRDGASVGAFTVLNPRQRIDAVPYSVQSEFIKDGNVFGTSIADMGASNGQVLTFNGSEWAPANGGGSGSSPWSVSGSNISYSDGNVGIGTSPFYPIDVRGTGAVPARFSGGDNMYVLFAENNTSRGYIGSFQSAAGTNPEDFELGVIGGGTGHLHLVTGLNKPALTVNNEGRVGIDNLDAAAKFQISSQSGIPEALRVQIDGSTKFYVDENGGASVGTFNTPPVNGLEVNGDTQQSIGSGGFIKFAVQVNCTSTPVVDRSFNGVNTGAITVAATGNAGRCVIDFPANINGRFWQVSAVYANEGGAAGGRSASCRLDTGETDKLRCERFLTDTRALSQGQMMITIY